MPYCTVFRPPKVIEPPVEGRHALSRSPGGTVSRVRGPLGVGAPEGSSARRASGGGRAPGAVRRRRRLLDSEAVVGRDGQVYDAELARRARRPRARGPRRGRASRPEPRLVHRRARVRGRDRKKSMPWRARTIRLYTRIVPARSFFQLILAADAPTTDRGERLRTRRTVPASAGSTARGPRPTCAPRELDVIYLPVASYDRFTV